MQKVREVVGGEEYEYVPLGEHVVLAEGVCGGRPTFKYTRIEVAGTLGRIDAGEEKKALAQGYRGRVSVEAMDEALRLREEGVLARHPDTEPRSS